MLCSRVLKKQSHNRCDLVLGLGNQRMILLLLLVVILGYICIYLKRKSEDPKSKIIFKLNVNSINFLNNNLETRVKIVIIFYI